MQHRNRDYFKRPVQSDRHDPDYGNHRLGSVEQPNWPFAVFVAALLTFATVALLFGHG